MKGNMPDANIIQMTDVERAEHEALVGDLPSRAWTLGKKVMLGTATVSECVECATESAEALLGRVNDLHPNDTTPVNAVKAARAWLQDPTLENYWQLEHLHNAGRQWVIIYNGFARAAAEAAWQAATTAYWAATMRREENAMEPAQGEAAEVNENMTLAREKLINAAQVAVAFYGVFGEAEMWFLKD